MIIYLTKYSARYRLPAWKIGRLFLLFALKVESLIVGACLNSMFPDLSHWIWLVVVAILLLLGLFWPIKCKAPIEARKFKDLYSHLRYCWLILEHNHYTSRDEIEKLSPLLEELDIKTPSRTHATMRMWKDFLEQLVRLAEAETNMENLGRARRIYSLTELEK